MDLLPLTKIGTFFVKICKFLTGSLEIKKTSSLKA